MLRALVALLALALLAPGARASSALPVVAALYPLAEWAAAVGGDRVTVRNLTPAGGDPHGFEPTPGDLKAARQARVVVTLAPGFQPAVDRVLAGSDAGQIRVVATAGLPLIPAHGHAEQHASGGDHGARHGGEGHGHGPYDPHVWLDPVRAKQIVSALAAALAKADPAGQPTFEANARAYAATLDTLDARFKATLGTCRQKTLVTSHAAFGYLADRYGLEQEAIRGLNPEAEPTPRRLAEVAKFVKAHGVRAIFTETVVSPKVAETLARETGARTLVLHTLESLDDAELAAGKRYATVMEENLRALATGLECRLPS
jgi:zinc transport system substrate-binding protein